MGRLSAGLRETLAVFETAPVSTPMTTSEVSDALDVGRRGTYNRLQRLVDEGHIETKQVGSRGRVWWRPVTKASPDHTDRNTEPRTRSGGSGDDRLGLDTFSRIDHAFLTVDADWTITSLNENAAELVDETPDELVGEHVWDVLTGVAGTRPQRLAERAMGEQEPIEFDSHSVVRDQWFEVRLFPEEPGLSVYLRDVTDQKRRERERERQRDRLDTLNDLNRVVHDTIDAVLDQSTREQVERVVCDALADSDSYTSAWIGAVDARNQRVETTARSGTSIDQSISIDPADRSGCPTVQAVHSRTIQVARQTDTAATTVAVPVEHDDTLYGVLTIQADRPAAFTAAEADVIDHLGEVVGHAIAAIQRKRALLGDEVVELDFTIEGIGSAIGVPDADGRLTIDRLVPANDGSYVAHGTATGGSDAILAGFVDTLEHWESATVIDDSDPGTRFEARLVDPPVLGTITELGGYVDSAFVEDDSYHMRVHLAPSADTRSILEAVTTAYPDAQLVTRRQRSRTDVTDRYSTLVSGALTERQRTVLEAAYYAGYFETPRKRSGGHVAASLGIAAPTFHQHLRKAQQRVVEAVLGTPKTEAIQEPGNRA